MFHLYFFRVSGYCSFLVVICPILERQLSDVLEPVFFLHFLLFPCPMSDCAICYWEPGSSVF